MINQTENKKTKEGFTMINHELYDWAIAVKLRGPELKIIHAIIRMTNGWNQRNEAYISFRLFGRKTSMGHRNAKKYVEQLLEKKIILRREGEKTKFGKPMFFYRLNKALCRLQNASQEDCCTAEASTVVGSMPATAVSYTPNKEINKNIKKPIRDIMNKCFNYEIHKEEKKSSSNENKKDESEIENCGITEK